MIVAAILYSEKDSSGKHLWRESPIDDMGSLPRHGVLGMIFFDENGLSERVWNRMNGRGDRAIGKDTDTYAVVLRPDGKYYAKHWDDEDENIYLRDRNAPQREYTKERWPMWFPPGDAPIIYKGDYVSPPEWKEALIEFDAMTAARRR